MQLVDALEQLQVAAGLRVADLTGLLDAFDRQPLAVDQRAGRIGGAGFDVLTREPPREGNPLLAPDIPNLVMTPHSAWGSCEARARMVAQLAANIRGFTAGESVRRVV